RPCPTSRWARKFSIKLPTPSMRRVTPYLDSGPATTSASTRTCWPMRTAASTSANLGHSIRGTPQCCSPIDWRYHAYHGFQVVGESGALVELACPHVGANDMQERLFPAFALQL